MKLNYKRTLLIGLALFLLPFFGLYRSPAVALMPDLTSKPLRSKGNTVINLMGAVGGLFALKEKKLGAEIVTDEEADDVMQPPFGEWKAAVMQTV